jgi:ferrochelatase
MKKGNCCSNPPPEVASVCYRHQSIATTAIMTKRLGIPENKVSSSFQSRFGREIWCTPYTDEELKRLPSTGVKKLSVVCPAFVADCLETLEEIGMQGRETFLKAGGESFNLIPCLNTHPLFIEALKEWARPVQD